MFVMTCQKHDGMHAKIEATPTKAPRCDLLAAVLRDACKASLDVRRADWAALLKSQIWLHAQGCPDLAAQPPAFAWEERALR